MTDTLRTILFDLDGVLIDSYPVWFQLLNHAARELGYPAISTELYETSWGQSTTADRDAFFSNHEVSEVEAFYDAHYFDHLDHAVNVAGIDHVCIGSDRDHRIIEDTADELRVLLEEEGAQLSAADWPLYMPAMNGPHRMRVVWDGLVQRGYAEDQIEKIMGRNLYRVYEEILG